MTIVDGLTQIHNKRYFLEFIDREMARCARYERPLSLLLFDIDHFKKINDVHGHLAGDFILKRLAEMVSKHIRKEEAFARYGGEEFAILMPETNGERARIFGEKIPPNGRIDRVRVRGSGDRSDGLHRDLRDGQASGSDLVHQGGR